MVSGSLRCAISLIIYVCGALRQAGVRSLHACEYVCPACSDRSGSPRASLSPTRWLVTAPAQVSGWSCYVDHMVHVD